MNRHVTRLHKSICKRKQESPKHISQRERTFSESSSSSSSSSSWSSPLSSSVSFSDLSEPEVEVDFPETTAGQRAGSKEQEQAEAQAEDQPQNASTTNPPLRLIPLKLNAQSQDPRSVFLLAPSSSSTTPTALWLQRFRREARRSNPTVNVTGVLPGALIQEERALLPSGVVYEIHSTWVPRPQECQKKSQWTQT